jgi:type VI secretion system secreted protein Hcp
MAIDAFLKFEGGNPEIKGESVVPGHTEELQIQSFSYSVSNSSSRHLATGGGVGKANHGDMSFMMFTDKSTTTLFASVSLGSHIDKATLVVRKAGGTEPVDYLKYEMEKCVITSWSTSGANGSEQATDSFSINFAKLTIIYTPQAEGGSGEGEVTQAINIAEGVAA